MANPPLRQRDIPTRRIKRKLHRTALIRSRIIHGRAVALELFRAVERLVALGDALDLGIDDGVDHREGNGGSGRSGRVGGCRGGRWGVGEGGEVPGFELGGALEAGEGGFGGFLGSWEGEGRRGKEEGSEDRGLHCCCGCVGLRFTGAVVLEEEAKHGVGGFVAVVWSGKSCA